MKRFLCITLFLCIIFPVSASAISWDLSGSSVGGTGSATLSVNVVGDTVTAVIDNTSPYGTPGSLADPGITGFGFDLLGVNSLPDQWKLTVASGVDENGNSLGTNFIIGGTGFAGAPGQDTWDLAYGATDGSINIEYLASNSNLSGVQGALYRPGATLTAANPNYFTTATLVMEFTGDSPYGPENPYIRMQNVGGDENDDGDIGDGSLKLVPEPSTMIISGLFLLGAGIFVRRKLHRKS
jgi:hypothetical protein